jgi:hypothetical protein
MKLQMKAQIKDMWLAALRSGNYRQGRSMLHGVPDDGPPTFCCLGVLCDLARTEGVIERRLWTDNNGLAYYHYDVATAYLPLSVIKWAGIKWLGERSMYDSTQYEVAGRYAQDGEATLARANDRGDTFEEIADVIEKYVEAVR